VDIATHCLQLMMTVCYFIEVHMLESGLAVFGALWVCAFGDSLKPVPSAVFDHGDCSCKVSLLTPDGPGS